MGCTTETGSPPQAATLPESVRRATEKTEALGGSLPVHRRRKGALCMRSCRTRCAPFRRCVVQVVTITVKVGPILGNYEAEEKIKSFLHNHDRLSAR